MEIVTGYTGQNHIESGDVQALLRGIMGKNLYILNSCECLEAEIVNANTIRINSGDLIFQGVHCRIPYGESDTVTIANGASGYNRTDVIAIRYEKDAETDEESVSWAYYRGGSNGKPPAVTKGNIEEGALVAEEVVFKIFFNGITPESIGAYGPTNNLPDIEEMAFGALVGVRNKADLGDAVYRPGDSGTLRFMPAAGELYNNKTSLRFFVPVPKPGKGVSGATITGGTFMGRAGGSVTIPTTNFSSASKTVTWYGNGIEILIKNNAGFGGTNNSVVAVSGYATVKFT